MEIVQKAMKNLGSSPYYGHNALLKVAALNSVGGFVGESNEDYKTLARLHQKDIVRFMPKSHDVGGSPTQITSAQEKEHLDGPVMLFPN